MLTQQFLLSVIAVIFLLAAKSQSATISFDVLEEEIVTEKPGTLTLPVPSSRHEGRITAAASTQPAIVEIIESLATRKSEPVFDRSCYSILPKTDYIFSVRPSPQLNDTRQNGYVYNRGQNVTLTCEMRPKTVKIGVRSGPKPYVFLSSCLSCGRWITSEAGRGRAELLLFGGTAFGNVNRCQFSCWQFNSTCKSRPRPDLFTPRGLECLREQQGSYKTIDFRDLPTSLGVQCMSLNWAGLNCTWTLRKGDSGQYTASIVYWFPCDGMVTGQNCSGPLTYVNVTDANLSEVGDGILVEFQCEEFHLLQQYHMVFRLRTLYGEVVANHSVQTNLRIVKFSPVEGQHVLTVAGNSSSLNVTWYFPREAWGGRSLECSFQVVPPMTAQWLSVSVVTVSVLPEAYKQSTLVITGLWPYTTYTVRMRFRPVDGLYWSEEKEASGTTAQDVPSKAPDVTPGGYVIRQCDDKDSQCLTVYWKELEPQYRNGVVTKYKAVVYSHDGRFVGGESVVDWKSYSTTISAVDGGTATLSTCVSVATSKGFSDQAGCITVLSGSSSYEGVPALVGEVTVDHVTANNSLLVHWTWATTSDSAPADLLTIFWCRGTSTPHVECKSKLHWSHLAPDTTSYLLSGFNTSDVENVKEASLPWRTGVASSRGNLSRGIVWNKCSFTDIGIRDQDFSLSAQETKITVTLSAPCGLFLTVQRPLRYDIYVIPVSRLSDGQNCAAGNITRRVDHPQLSNNRLVFGDLESGATYSVCLRTEYQDGQGQWSEPKNVTLMPKIPGRQSQDSVIAFALVPIAGLGLVIAVCYFSWQKVQRSRKKFASDISDPMFDAKMRWSSPRCHEESLPNVNNGQLQLGIATSSIQGKPNLAEREEVNHSSLFSSNEDDDEEANDSHPAGPLLVERTADQSVTATYVQLAADTASLAGNSDGPSDASQRQNRPAPNDAVNIKKVNTEEGGSSGYVLAVAKEESSSTKSTAGVSTDGRNEYFLTTHQCHLHLSLRDGFFVSTSADYDITGEESSQEKEVTSGDSDQQIAPSAVGDEFHPKAIHGENSPHMKAGGFSDAANIRIFSGSSTRDRGFSPYFRIASDPVGQRANMNKTEVNGRMKTEQKNSSMTAHRCGDYFSLSGHADKQEKMYQKYAYITHNQRKELFEAGRGLQGNNSYISATGNDGSGNTSSVEVNPSALNFPICGFTCPREVYVELKVDGFEIVNREFS